ncbi:MAG: ATP-binding cassette domain-containing protein [Planctomycetes bacterium]|nr:ATP-binding cassette domain-containing protein [Planctomycetota bacterium]
MAFGDPKNAIEAEGLGKAYRLHGSPIGRVLGALSFGSYRSYREHNALQDVTFTVGRGEALGVVGANGAGKSTLLKILSGTTDPTAGRFRVAGHVASLLELGAGFHPEFSGRENIYLNGALLGYSRKELDRLFPVMLEFSELGEFIDRPLRTYSSGMAMRLGFSVAVHLDPEVLIIDEVFAVGDMHFAKKCADKVYDFRRRGKTILFCSHSLYDVRQLCDRAIWLDHGKVRLLDDAVTVTNEYAAFSKSLDANQARPGEWYVAPPKRETMPSIDAVRIMRMGTDEQIYDVAPGDAIDVRIWYRNPDPYNTKIHIAVGFQRNDSTLVTADTTEFARIEVPGGAGCVTYRCPRLILLSGSFTVFGVCLDEPGLHRFDTVMAPSNLNVRSRTKDVGLVLQDHSWIVEPGHCIPTPAAAPSSAGEP